MSQPIRPPYQAAPPPYQPSSNATLPPGWTSAVDPNSGQTYYINNTNPPQTQWIHPGQSPSYAPPNQQGGAIVAPVAGSYVAPVAPSYIAPVAAMATVSQPVMPGGPATNGGMYANVHAGAGGTVGTVYAPVGNGATVSANTQGQVTASKWESVAVNDRVTLSGGVHAGTAGVGVSTGANVKMTDNTSVWVTPGGGASVSTNIGGMNINVGKGGINLGVGGLRLPLPRKN